MHYPFKGYTILLGQKVELGQKVVLDGLEKKRVSLCDTLLLGCW